MRIDVTLAAETMDKPEAEPTFQLLYISAANHDFTEEELEALLIKARSNNEKVNVSGMLLYHEGSFIQALEGPKEQVEKIYQKISKDTRHTETRILFKGDSRQRDFHGWSMGFYRSKQSGDENLEGFHQFLTNGFRHNGEGVNDGTARKALLAFREGKWRQHVDV